MAPFLPLNPPLYVTTRLSTSSQQQPPSLPNHWPLPRQLLPLKQLPQLPLHRPNPTPLIRTTTLLPIAQGISSKLRKHTIPMPTPLKRRVKPKHHPSIIQVSSTIRRGNNNTVIHGTSTPPKRRLPLPPLLLRPPPMPRAHHLNPRRHYPLRMPASSAPMHRRLARAPLRTRW